jgi:glycosyltransferase involved in cell wall biosynthesis
MKILYVVTCLGVGGAEMQVLALADSFAREGHAVQIAVLTDAPAGSEELTSAHPVLFLHMRKNPLWLVRALWQVRRLVKKYRPDIVHSHMFHSNVFTRLLRWIAPVPRLICTVHNTTEGGKHVGWIYRCTDWLADTTTNVSAAGTARYIAIRAAPPGKIQTVHNGIDVEKFKPDAVVRARVRQELGCADGFMWLAVGRLAEQKDYPNLMRAMARLPRSPTCKRRLSIAGAGDFTAVGELAESLGIEDEIVFLGIRKDIPRLMNAADGFVLSSAWEGMPLALGEAMASGCVPVATDAGGVREVIGDAGLVVPVRDSVALAAAMAGIEVLSAEQRAERGQRARASVEAKFALGMIAKQWLDLYGKAKSD